MKIELKSNVKKYLEKLLKSNFKQSVKIKNFLTLLESFENPFILSNCKKIESADDNRWRWRVGEYRIIGIIEKDNDIKIILVIKIDKKDDNTYK